MLKRWIAVFALVLMSGSGILLFSATLYSAAPSKRRWIPGDDAAGLPFQEGPAHELPRARLPEGTVLDLASLAGTYRVFGRYSGRSVRINLDGTWRYDTWSCLHQPYSTGRVRFADGRIELILNTASDKPRRSAWCTPVTWDKCTYLLGADRVEDFLEAVHEGWRPQLPPLDNESEHDWKFLVKGTEEPRGFPLLPE